jgi:hypothetical protein
MWENRGQKFEPSSIFPQCGRLCYRPFKNYSKLWKSDSPLFGLNLSQIYWIDIFIWIFILVRIRCQFQKKSKKNRSCADQGAHSRISFFPSWHGTDFGFCYYSFVALHCAIVCHPISPLSGSSHTQPQSLSGLSFTAMSTQPSHQQPTVTLSSINGHVHHRTTPCTHRRPKSFRCVNID